MSESGVKDPFKIMVRIRWPRQGAILWFYHIIFFSNTRHKFPIQISTDQLENLVHFVQFFLAFEQGKVLCVGQPQQLAKFVQAVTVT
tara:strand:+ start:296 stop:556 length:261 start_codon:yes stop_codon:yes gene_type:complete